MKDAMKGFNRALAGLAIVFAAAVLVGCQPLSVTVQKGPGGTTVSTQGGAEPVRGGVVSAPFGSPSTEGGFYSESRECRQQGCDLPKALGQRPVQFNNPPLEGKPKYVRQEIRQETSLINSKLEFYHQQAATAFRVYAKYAVAKPVPPNKVVAAFETYRERLIRYEDYIARNDRGV